MISIPWPYQLTTCPECLRVCNESAGGTKRRASFNLFSRMLASPSQEADAVQNKFRKRTNLSQSAQL